MTGNGDTAYLDAVVERIQDVLLNVDSAADEDFGIVAEADDMNYIQEDCEVMHARIVRYVDAQSPFIFDVVNS
jgi:hypothetical protein